MSRNNKNDLQIRGSIYPQTSELVKDDEEPSEGRGWRAKQPACPAVKPFVIAASPDAADAGRLFRCSM